MEGAVTLEMQRIIELTKLMMRKHYCENDIEPIIQLMDEHIVWFGAGEHEYAVGRETVADIFRNFAGQVPKCNISDEEYHVLLIVPGVYLCSGRMWIETDSSTQISLRVHQRVTMIFRQIGDSFRCCHIHISNPYDDMVEDDIGFPVKMAQQSYQYLQEQIKAQKTLLSAQTIALERLSYEDALTGLYNRNKFNQVMDSASAMHQNQLGIACFDLNGLKEENDKRGHSAGDILICSAAEKLQQAFKGKVYRIGGDEFVVVEDVMMEDEFQEIIHMLQNEMEKNGISCSVGISWRSGCCSMKEQLEEADFRMYEQKRRFYSRKENDRRNRRDFIKQPDK